MDNKENKFEEQFIDELMKYYDSKQGQNGLVSLDETKAEAAAKFDLLFSDIPNSPNVIPYFSSNINFLQKELDKLDTKIDKELKKVDTKIDKSNDKITSEFRWLIGILFILFLALAGWIFYINK